MKQNLNFRGYEVADYKVLKEMIFALAHEDIDPQESGIAMSVEKIESTILRSITHPGQLRIKIFEVDKVIVGYAILTFYWSNEYHGVVAILDELYVKENFRGRGFATEFIQHLAQIKEYAILQLEVFKENKKALKLYERMGFEIVDRHFMNKTL